MASTRRGSTSRSTLMTATGSEASVTTTNRLSASHPHSAHSDTFQTGDYITTASRPRTSHRSTARPSTARPRTGISTLGVPDQEIVCAVSESRGISPTVGLAFVNLDTGEAVLSQISDSQTYVRTVHKLLVYNPSTALIVGTAANPKSKLFSIIEESVEPLGTTIELLDRRYWAETTGLEYIQQLAFADDVETVKTAVGGNYYAVCCFAAVLKYVELSMGKTFPFRSLRIKYEPSEGSMMIDLSTIHSLELVQNLQNTKSKECLFGLLNQTLTPMGARLLRANILQPLTNPDTLNTRYEAVEELSTKEEMFFAVRAALKSFLDVDKMLTQLILIPTQPTLKDTEQAVNNVMMLKQFVGLIPPVFEALTGSRCTMLHEIRGLCNPDHVDLIRKLINEVINEDVTFAKKPVELRNQRSYAVRSGVNGLLDVARQTYHESMNDAYQHVTELKDEHKLDLNLKFETTRQFFLRLSANELEDRNLPAVFINAYRKKDIIECQTLHLMKQNQKIADAHTEVLLMSDKAVQDVIVRVREYMSILFKICEGIAVLDMLASFAQVVTSRDYARPQIGDTLAIRAARHPIRENIHNAEFVPNDVYATQQTRFQVITGCNMSGKSTYIRSIALMTVMAHIGSFVPAEFAVFPITRQLFARISLDDNVEANVSTFAAEMRETAFILRNTDRQSMAIIDELGRGTSTRDGLAIALAIAEALVQSRALVWFVTHFTDLAQIMSQRNGVVNYHLAVDMSEQNKMEMQYRLSSGTERQEHYGLKLARVVPLPPDVLEHAEEVSRTLEQQAKRKKKRSLGIIRNRRRTLLLNLKEQLVQARAGKMEGEELREWLKRLQGNFVLQMTALEEEERKAELSGAEDEDGSSLQQHGQDLDSVSGFVHDADGESEMLLGDDGEAWMAGGNDGVEQIMLRSE